MTNTHTQIAGLNPLGSRLMAFTGQFVGVSWTRPIKVYKDLAHSVTKSVRTVVRVGLSYDARAVVQNARADGTAPAVNAGLPWGEWLAFPYVVAHKGKLYVRLYPVASRSCKVIYRLNGRMVRKSALAGIALASELDRESTPTECYTLAQENLRSVRPTGKVIA